MQCLRCLSRIAGSAFAALVAGPYATRQIMRFVILRDSSPANETSRSESSTTNRTAYENRRSSCMSYEVELKFRLDSFQSVENVLRELDAVEQSMVSHVDRYFNHPSRDFRTTDEAFRIRSVGDANFLTYKGAVIGNVAKTRHEIEVGFDAGAESTDQFLDIVRHLGFRFVREVRKTRRSFHLDWNERKYELAFDELPELGRFIEIELLADDDDREAAETAVWNLADLLGLSKTESRSYLDLLLAFDDQVL